MIIDQEPPNIYELPTCPICITPLVQDINCLSCGHAYHFQCIAQHFQYKGTCPSCQKRATQKELRRILYRPIPLKGKGQKQLDKIMNDLEKSEIKPFQYMVSEVRKYAQLNDKLQKQNKKYEQKQAEKREKLQENAKLIVQKQNKIRQLKQQVKNLKKNVAQLNENISIKQQIIQQKNEKLDQFEQKDKEFKEIQKYKIWVHQSNVELSRYYQDLISSKTPYEEIAETFFNLTLLKTLELAKFKLNRDQSSIQLEKKQKQNWRLHSQIGRLKKDKETLRQEKIQQNKKYQQLKVKYRTLRERAKAANENKSSNIELQLSNGYDSKKSQPAITEEIQRPILKKYQKAPLPKPDEQNQNQLQLKYGGFKLKNNVKMNSLASFMIKK